MGQYTSTTVSRTPKSTVALEFTSNLIGLEKSPNMGFALRSRTFSDTVVLEFALAAITRDLPES
jgi:hypothetical protein